MNKTKHFPIIMILMIVGKILIASIVPALAVAFWIFTFSYECPARTITSSPSSDMTPENDAIAEEVYEFILEQPDCESWTDSNYDPVETRGGIHIVPKDEIYQSTSTGLAVICTHGYENHYYDDGSGDIRGLWHQGFIDIEGTEVAFRLMDLFVSTAWAKSDKWKQVKAIKKLSKLQTKPAKPKKTKWKKEFGLKEKKDALEVTP